MTKPTPREPTQRDTVEYLYGCWDAMLMKAKSIAHTKGMVEADWEVYFKRADQLKKAHDVLKGLPSAMWDAAPEQSTPATPPSGAATDDTQSGLCSGPTVPVAGGSAGTLSAMEIERLLDNAACASQCRELLRDDYDNEHPTREAVRLNIVVPLAARIEALNETIRYLELFDHDAPVRLEREMRIAAESRLAQYEALHRAAWEWRNAVVKYGVESNDDALGYDVLWRAIDALGKPPPPT